MNDQEKQNGGSSMVLPKSTEPGLTEKIQSDLENLSSVLKKVRNKWTPEWNQKDDEIHSLIQGHKSTMNNHNGMVGSLQDTLKELEEQELNKRKVCEEKEESIKKFKATMSEVKQNTDTLLRQKEIAQQCTEKLEEENKKNKEVLEEEESSSKRNAEELEKSTQFFRERLGLQLKRISGERLQFVFTCLDAKDPNRPFYFCVKINSDRSYSVTECEPTVPDLKTLVERLDMTNNFRSFIITMRKQFIKMV